VFTVVVADEQTDERTDGKHCASC